jgi:hypothetical protein
MRPKRLLVFKPFLTEKTLYHKNAYTQRLFQVFHTTFGRNLVVVFIKLLIKAVEKYAFMPIRIIKQN